MPSAGPTLGDRGPGARASPQHPNAASPWGAPLQSDMHSEHPGSRVRVPAPCPSESRGGWNHSCSGWGMEERRETHTGGRSRRDEPEKRGQEWGERELGAWGGGWPQGNADPHTTCSPSPHPTGTRQRGLSLPPMPWSPWAPGPAGPEFKARPKASPSPPRLHSGGRPPPHPRGGRAACLKSSRLCKPQRAAAAGPTSPQAQGRAGAGAAAGQSAVV